MIRSLIILLGFGWVTAQYEAQGPGAPLFEERAHDFGTVPRIAKSSRGTEIRHVQRARLVPASLPPVHTP